MRLAFRDVDQPRGGYKGPLPIRDFVLQYLQNKGEDYVANIHRAYLEELWNIAVSKGRIIYTATGNLSRWKSRPYHKTTYKSFNKELHDLVRAGLVEPSGNEEVSDMPQFSGWDEAPIRRYYRLASGVTSTTKKKKQTVRTFKTTVLTPKEITPAPVAAPVKQSFRDLPIEPGKKKKK